jgi:putative peptide zinc metalloprotease protein
MTPAVTGKSRIVLHELAFHKENDDEMLVGRTDIGHYIVIPLLGWEVLKHLREGKTIGQIEALLTEEHKEPVEVLEFVQELITAHPFVRELDGVVIHERVPVKEHLPWIPASWGRMLFHPAAFTGYLLLLLFIITAFVLQPHIVPRGEDFFFSPTLPMNVLLALGVSWLVLFFHELAHLVAARSIGVASRFGFGHRLVFPVAETDMSNIVVVPYRLRYRAYLAGLCSDSVFLAAATGIQLLHHAGVLSLEPGTVLTIRMIAFHVMNLMLFQLLFFMKTDLYYVVTTFFRCRSLLEHTQLFLKGLIRRECRDVWETLPFGERKLIRGYVWFYAAGVVLTVLWFVSIQVPVLYRLVSEAAVVLQSKQVFSLGFAEGLLLIVLCLLPMGLLLWSWSRKRRGAKGGEHLENKS